MEFKSPKNIPPASPILKGSDVEVLKLKFGIANRLTKIEEDPDVLKYCTPQFRARATVQIPPLPDDANIQIGWIQVCTDMRFINTYGNHGLTTWELPELASGKYEMVNDSNGKLYPWYGRLNEVIEIEGPTHKAIVKQLKMSDNFEPQVGWRIPCSNYTRDPCLTFVYRMQKSYTYLVLKDLDTDIYQIIKTLAWSMELAIDVNPMNPVGKRAKLIGPFEQECSKIIPEHLSPPLKCYALNPPNANSCQTLLWIPRTGEPRLLKKPVQTTVDMNSYMVSNWDEMAKWLQIAKQNILLRNKDQLI